MFYIVTNFQNLSETIYYSRDKTRNLRHPFYDDIDWFHKENFNGMMKVDSYAYPHDETHQKHTKIILLIIAQIF